MQHLEDDIHGDAETRFDTICAELRKFDPVLAERPQVVLLSKTDLADPDRLAEITAAFEARGLTTMTGSAVTGQGMDALVHAVVAAIDAEGNA